MKKIFLFTALIVSVNLAGQDFRIGINLDPVLSWFSPNYKRIEKEGMKLGFSGGLVLEKYFQKNYAFATGINLAYIGGNLKYLDTTNIKYNKGETTILPNTIVNYTLQYISIPLSLK